MTAAREAGFEVVEKSNVPQSDSEEVKSAISAQGEDGQLLVNYVQVSKDDVPAVVPENNAAISGDEPPANGTDTKEMCKGGELSALLISYRVHSDSDCICVSGGFR